MSAADKQLLESRLKKVEAYIADRADLAHAEALTELLAVVRALIWGHAKWKRGNHVVGQKR